MSEFDFTAYIKSLSKEQLVAMVLKFAPDTFREEILHQNLDESRARIAFEKLAKGIRRLFEDEELLYEPSDFNTNLVGATEKLAGFWAKFPKETGDIFLFCLKKINEVQDEGMLYNSYYDEVYDGSSFLAIIQQYVASLPFEQKMEFVGKLEEVLDAFGYDTFYSYGEKLSSLYSESEISRLKTVFIENVGIEDKPFRARYYKFLRGTLDIKEKEYVLTHIYHLDRSLTLELVETLCELQKPEAAIRFLEELKQANPSPLVFEEALFVKLLELKQASGLSIQTDIRSGLKVYGTNSLLKSAIDFLPGCRLEFESILESTSHPNFLKYLIEKNRIDEAYNLVMASRKLDDQSVYRFFTTYSKLYPEDATKYFIGLINKELPSTGDHHYESIVNSLQYIRKVDPAKAHEIVSMLKSEYKRRRNLMSMLESF